MAQDIFSLFAYNSFLRIIERERSKVFVVYVHVQKNVCVTWLFIFIFAHDDIVYITSIHVFQVETCKFAFVFKLECAITHF